MCRSIINEISSHTKTSEMEVKMERRIVKRYLCNNFLLIPFQLIHNGFSTTFQLFDIWSIVRFISKGFFSLNFTERNIIIILLCVWIFYIPRGIKNWSFSFFDTASFEWFSFLNHFLSFINWKFSNSANHTQLTEHACQEQFLICKFKMMRSFLLQN